MTIKKEMVIREVGGDWILVPTGDSVLEYNGLFTLSEAGAFIWQHLEQAASDEDIVKLMLEEYDVDEQTARHDTQAFLNELRSLEII